VHLQRLMHGLSKAHFVNQLPLLSRQGHIRSCGGSPRYTYYKVRAALACSVKGTDRPEYLYAQPMGKEKVPEDRASINVLCLDSWLRAPCIHRGRSSQTIRTMASKRYPITN
jgi:hypothetical protein